MNPEELEQLKELIEFLKESKVGEFALERGELKVQLRFQPEGGSGEGSIDAATLGQLIGGLQGRLQGGLPGVQAGAVLPPPALADSGAALTTPAPLSETASPSAVESGEVGLHTVKSPIVGTFYESPSPGASAFVQIGDHIEAGKPLCIIEAMKLMNEIESDATGEVVKRLVNNGQAVEYGQPLFLIRATV